MIGDLIMAAFEIGKNVSFTYLKDVERGYGTSGRTADYTKNAESYSGEIVEIRDLEKNPVSSATVNYGAIKGERSKQLVTVETPHGETKAFYDGRMVNAKVSEQS
tara:strand:+ start:558 stop:872 length:315 start_codon:yes stop_codon:yes gene_type:complete